MATIYEQIVRFQRMFPMTVGWRLKKNASVVEKHLNPGEEAIYCFVAQKSFHCYDIFQTCAVVLTNRRILIGRDRVVVGYFLDAITPDLFNDLKVKAGLLWGKIIIDTVKERVVLSHIDKRALDEIETKITDYMMNEKEHLTSRDK